MRCVDHAKNAWLLAAWLLGCYRDDRLNDHKLNDCVSRSNDLWSYIWSYIRCLHTIDNSCWRLKLFDDGWYRRLVMMDMCWHIPRKAFVCSGAHHGGIVELPHCIVGTSKHKVATQVVRKLRYTRCAQVYSLGVAMLCEHGFGSNCKRGGNRVRHVREALSGDRRTGEADTGTD